MGITSSETDERRCSGSFPLAVFLKDIVEMIQIKAQQKGLKFVCEIPDNLHETLYADEIRLRQILLSLLGNAIKIAWGSP